MIRSVELSDWRSHEKTRLEFSRGTNLLIGIMGSGKSSVETRCASPSSGRFQRCSTRR